MGAHVARISILAAIALVLAPGVTLAGDVQVGVTVDPMVIPVGSEATMVVTVQGKFRKGSSPELPPMDEFSVYQAGSSQSFSIVNGRTSSNLQFTYVIVPKTEGTYTIHGITFETDGKVYTADPVTVEVVKSYSQVPPSTGSGPDEVEPPDVTDEAIFVVAHVDRDTVYVNQQITWTLGFYTDGTTDLMRSPEYQPPSAEGFWVEDLPPQQNSYKKIKGQRYLVNEIKRAFFPTVPGEHAIGSARVDVVTDDFWNKSIDDFFRRRRGAFGFGKTTTLRTDEISIVVLPLPTAGRPGNFSGLVGRDLELSVKTDKQVVAAGEPINLTMEVRGQGNFKTMAAPELPELDGFKMYESGSKSDIFKKGYLVSGRKRADFVLIPKAEGEMTIPSIRMAYFDPVDRTYKTIESAPIRMSIEPGAKEESGRQVVFTGTGEDIQVLSTDISFIHPVPASIGDSGSPFYSSRLFLAAHALPLLALVAAIAVERRRSRWRKDVALARRSRAAREAEKKLKRAGEAHSKGDHTGAFGLVSSAVRDYFADKMNDASSGLTLEAIDAFLGRAGAGEEERERVAGLLRTCDRVQYAPGDVGGDDAKAAVDGALAALKEIERVLR